MNLKKLNQFYDQFSSGDRVLVIINADPDAIASAMAVKRLLWRRVSGVTISHVNVIKRPDNLAMIRLLGVKLLHTDDIDELYFDRFVIVDSQPNHHETFYRFSPNVVIDHHPKTDVKAPFLDIRPEYGATSTIMTEYLRNAGIKPSAKLATALFHAIKIDTSNFERQSIIEDVQAFHFLFRHANIHLARKMEQADIRLDFLKYFKIALNDMRILRSRIYVHLGQVINPDVCVLIADFFMRVNPVSWSIVSGICNKNLTIIFRNDGLRKDAGKAAKQSFGDFGSAGGHKSMARAEIPLENLENTDHKALSSWIIHQVEKKQKQVNVKFKKDILGVSEK